MSDSNDYEGDESEFELVVTAEDQAQFKRLDHYLTHKLPNCSRSFLKQVFESGLIELEVPETPSHQTHVQKLELKKMPAVGSKLLVNIPPPLPTKAEPENIPLEILYEDEHLIIINKPAGLVTHPAPGHPSGTLVNAILYHCQDLKGIGDQKRPGIVHRLDKGTSGVMVVAKTQKCHEGLVLLFSSHDIERRYQAIVVGADKFLVKGPLSGTLEGPIGRHPTQRLKMAINPKHGKFAKTHYRVLAHNQQLMHMELTLDTGRTHQIRVHLSQLLGTSILCDPLYGNPKSQLKHLSPEINDILRDYPHPLLHAKVLGFTHPITKTPLHFESPVPDTFEKVLNLVAKT